MENCLVNGVATLQCVPQLIGNVIFAFLLLSGTIALFFAAYGSITLILSGGDPKKVTSGRQTITYAIIGLIVVLTSFAVVYFIGYVTGTTECITDPRKILTGC